MNYKEIIRKELLKVYSEKSVDEEMMFYPMMEQIENVMQEVERLTREEEEAKRDEFASGFAEWLLENIYMNSMCSFMTMTEESQGKEITTTELLEQFKQSIEL